MLGKQRKVNLVDIGRQRWVLAARYTFSKVTQQRGKSRRIVQQERSRGILLNVGHLLDIELDLHMGDVNERIHLHPHHHSNCT